MYQSNNNLLTVATCTLNQWALDFRGNIDRIYRSCKEARETGASYRLGPELEICGYGCEDHFLEMDTFDHCWESLSELVRRGATHNLICDFGMPVLHNGARYNCRILCLNQKILLIRPKISLADNGNYRESRFFTAYRSTFSSENATNDISPFLLPSSWVSLHNQRSAPFGIYYLKTPFATIGCESCEELWTPYSTHIDLSLCGIDIIGNGSGSHHELRKLAKRFELIICAMRKCGGIYLYANQRGCDGGRLYYDGCAMIVVNGTVLAQANQFDVRDVQTIVATVNLNDVRSYRANLPSFGYQSSSFMGSTRIRPQPIDCFTIDFGNQISNINGTFPYPSSKITTTLHSPQEECCYGPACWLWDYLRRSGATGFLLPLSGGADSAAVATIVGCMCHMVTTAAKDDTDVAKELFRVCHTTKIPTPQQMANCLFHTLYLSTEHSSPETKKRAEQLAGVIGSYHISFNIDRIISSILYVFTLVTKRTPHFSFDGGSITQDVSLQNLQARIRMVLSYLFAQLLPWIRNKSTSGFLLVLGTANVDESLRGYMTKYDCSSADLNPIGSISKQDLKKMLQWACDKYHYDVLKEILQSQPTAELRPDFQIDEEDMNMSYTELGIFGRLRKSARCGPISMFRKLHILWNHLSPPDVALKVKQFFVHYSRNRHKMCTITPAYHAEVYSPDDNRFDLRPFLYNTKWTHQFEIMDKLVKELNDRDIDKIERGE